MRFRFGILLLLVFALVVAACGDDDADPGTDRGDWGVEDLDLVEAAPL